MPKLTPKQELFCKEYIIDFNATQAAARANYSKKTANQVGSENLAKPGIIARIGQLVKKTTEKLEISAQMVIAELALIAFGDKYKEEDIKMSDRLKALEGLGRYFKLFTDKIEHAGLEGKSLYPNMSNAEISEKVKEIMGFDEFKN